MKKLVIIPAYNEKDSIVNTVKDIKDNAQGFDYIVVNDCSTDNTYDVCVENGLKVINLPLNLGIGGAVQTGYLYAFQNGYDIAVQFDGDGQHDAAHQCRYRCLRWPDDRTENLAKSPWLLLTKQEILNLHIIQYIHEKKTTYNRCPYVCPHGKRTGQSFVDEILCDLSRRTNNCLLL